MKKYLILFKYISSLKTRYFVGKCSIQKGKYSTRLFCLLPFTRKTYLVSLFLFFVFFFKYNPRFSLLCQEQFEGKILNFDFRI